jgi:NAD(P)-dependent dehydrogenase (short-subunit alcohol dehydrogenase family)
MDNMRFDGRVAIVTGAGRGVGRCHALALAERGARVVIADLGGTSDGSGASHEPADQVVQEIVGAGGDAVACYGSVTSELDTTAMVQTALDSFGRLDILINNAGISAPERFEDQTTEQFRRMLEVQYLGTVYVTKAAWPHFVQAGFGRIVNTCSEGPLGIHEMMTSYGGAKGGVIGFTLALAAESGKYGIAVNGFSPRAATRLSSPDVLSHIYDLPKETFEESMVGFPPELASPAAVYLANEHCPLNGVILVSGGGQVLRMAIMQNQGFTSDDVSLESIHTNLAQIVDMSGAQNVGVGAGGAAELPTVTLAGGDTSS